MKIAQREMNKISKENRKNLNEFENSIDGIMHAMTVWGETTCEDEKNKVLVCETLQLLPL